MTNVTDGWTRCRPNEITKLAGRIRTREQRRMVGNATLLVASVSLLIGGWFFLKPNQGPDFAGISCERVMDLSDAYMNKQLSPELQDQIQRHIALCPNCRGLFEGMPPLTHFRPRRLTSPQTVNSKWPASPSIDQRPPASEPVCEVAYGRVGLARYSEVVHSITLKGD